LSHHRNASATHPIFCQPARFCCCLNRLHFRLKKPQRCKNGVKIWPIGIKIAYKKTPTPTDYAAETLSSPA
ncbi:hypothetical protein ACWXVX_19180, partial [Pantoea dispersa]